MSDIPSETESFNAALGGVLKELRLRNRLSGDQLSHVISRAYLRKLEAGIVQPGLAVFLKLCEAYRVPPSCVLIAAEARLANAPPMQYGIQLLSKLEALTSVGYLGAEALDQPEKQIVKQRAVELRVDIRMLAAGGVGNTEIARRLGVSLRTVQRHLKD